MSAPRESTSNTGLQVQDSVSESFLRACKTGSLSGVQRNFDQAEMSNTRDRHGNTGLILAAEYGQDNIVSHLIKLDEDPLHINAANEAGRTALMVAVDRGRRKVVEMLLQHPSTIRSITDKFGMSAQTIANLRQDTRIVQLLGGTPAPAIAKPAPPPARHEQSQVLEADRASRTSTSSNGRIRSLGRLSPSATASLNMPELSVSPPPLPMAPRRSRTTKEPSGEREVQSKFQRGRSRSLGRSLDENECVAKNEDCETFASSIEDDILGDIRTKIEAKIRNCEDMIEVERAAAPTREDFNEMKRDKMSQMLSDINRERVQFRRKQTSEREKFNEKQRMEMEEFQREAQIRQDQIELDLAEKEKEVEESEKNILNYQQTIRVLIARQEHLAIDPLAEKKPKEAEYPQDVKEQLECPVCLELMYPPLKIFQCSQGHALCGKCRPKCKNCPTCRGPIIGRATVLEHLAQSLLGKDPEANEGVDFSKVGP